jgi:hypothetical protein
MSVTPKTSDRPALTGASWAHANGRPPVTGTAADLVPFASIVGLTVVAATFALERSGAGGPLAVVFWLGFAAMLLPIVWALLADRTSRGDRIVLVLLAGLLAYAVKVLRDPTMFAFSDEFIHLSGTQRLVEAHALFQQIPLSGVGVASGYPGLHVVAATLHEVSGLPLVACGLITIGVARGIVMLGLYLLFELVSGSPRVAALGALLYAGNANYLFWSSQFSYESLSLPLFVVAVLTVLLRPTFDRRGRVALTGAAVLLTVAVIATHHLTAYALAGVYWLLTIGSWRSERPIRATDLAIGATLGAAAWFVFVADGTGAYLDYIFDRTFTALLDAGGGTRAPFQSDGPLRSPLWERALAFLSLAIVCAGVAVSLIDLVRRRALRTVPLVVLAVAAAAFLVVPPLKLFPGAWETANRAGNFLFLGVGLVLALGAMRLIERARRPALVRGVLSVTVVVVIVGGAAQGWPGAFRLSQPVRVEVGDATITTQSLGAAEWAARHLPADAIYAADEISGRRLAIHGARFVLAGRAAGIPSLLSETRMNDWTKSIVLRAKVDYVVVDQRKYSADVTAGFYFPTTAHPDGGFGTYPAGVRRKFSRLPRSRRIYDSGDVVIYDVRGLREPAPDCRTIAFAATGQGLTCRQDARRLTLAGRDGIARLPGLRARLLGTRAEVRVRGVEFTVRVQLLNTSSAAYAPDPARRALYLAVGEHRVRREARAPERTDNLDGNEPLAPKQQREVSLRFRLTRRELAAVRRGDASLGVVAPGRPGDVGVIDLRTAAQP